MYVANIDLFVFFTEIMTRKNSRNTVWHESSNPLIADETADTVKQDDKSAKVVHKNTLHPPIKVLYER